jgi:hypothetical protein
VLVTLCTVRGSHAQIARLQAISNDMMAVCFFMYLLLLHLTKPVD